MLTFSYFSTFLLLVAILDEPVVVELESLEDCVKFLWSDSSKCVNVRVHNLGWS